MEYTQPVHTLTINEVLETTRLTLEQHGYALSLSASDSSAWLILSHLTSPLKCIEERLFLIGDNESLADRLDLITINTDGHDQTFLHCLHADMQTICTHLQGASSGARPLDPTDADVYVKVLVRYAELLKTVRQVDFEMRVHTELGLLHEALTDLRTQLSREKELSEEEIHARLARLRPVESAFHNAWGGSVPLSDPVQSGVVSDIFDWLDDTSGSPDRCSVFWFQGEPRYATTAIARSVALRAHSEGRLLSSYFFPWAGQDEGRKPIHLIPTIMYQVALSDPDFKLRITRSIGMDRNIQGKDATAQIYLLLKKSLEGATSPFAVSPLVIIDAMDACDDLDKPQVVQDIRLFMRTLVATPLFVKLLIISQVQQPIRLLLEGDDPLSHRHRVLPMNGESQRSKPPMSDADRDIVKQLKVVPTAKYDSALSPPGCLDGTRVNIIKDMISWCVRPTDRFAIYWLAGHAGTGKSTIAKTLCEQLVSQSISLVVTFFVSKNFAERRDPLGILHTVAYELADADIVMRRHVIAALRSTASISSRPLKEQVKSLLLAAIKDAVNVIRPVVLIIDALDECSFVQGVGNGGDLIHELAHTLADMSVRLVVTSRMEDDLRRVFGSLSSEVVRLHEIEKESVRSDVHHILRDGFSTIAIKHEISVPWPSQEDIDTLVKRTGSFIIFGATVLKFVDNRRFGPMQSLSQIMERTSSGHHLAPVDQLYSHVLYNAARRDQESEEIDPELSSRIRALLGMVVLLRKPLSIWALAQLMNVDVEDIYRDIIALSAVLLVSSDDDSSGDGCVRIFHPSFRDFLLERCTEPAFAVGDEQHHEIARYCLETMNNTLKYDLCDIKDPTLSHSEVTNPPLSERINQHIPAAVRYACEFWIFHILQSTSPDDNLLSTLRAFILNHILHWIEAHTLMDYPCISGYGHQLAHMIPWTKRFVVKTDECDAYPIIKECFVMLDTVDDKYIPPFHDNLLELYYSGPIFLPQCFPHLAALQQGPDPSCLPRLIRGRVPRGTEAALVFEGHTEWVFSVAFSPDGSKVASGSEDHTIRIWDPLTGLETATLNGHSGWVRSVAFSPDGTQIVSGSDDTTIRLWDACTGSKMATLWGHTAAVTSVAFSHDGAHIISGSHDTTVRIWNTQTRQEVAKLEVHFKWINRVLFSPDNRDFVISACDGTFCLWNAYSGHEIHRFNHDAAVESVAFSPDGTEVVGVSGDDKPLKAWSIQTGLQTGRFRHHGEPLTCVSFSPDGVFVACGSHDGTLTLWHRPTFLVITRFWGHTGMVNSVAFSPNGRQIVSGASDNTVQLWDIPPLSQENLDALWDIHRKHWGTSSWDTIPDYFAPKIEGHTDEVLDVKFSPDGSLIASCSKDGTARLWEAYTGAEIAKIPSSERINRLVFSPDGKSVGLFLGEDGDVLYVWDISHKQSATAVAGDERYFDIDNDMSEIRAALPWWSSVYVPSNAQSSTIHYSNMNTGDMPFSGLSSLDKGLAPLPSSDSLEVMPMVSPLHSLTYNDKSRYISLDGSDKTLRLCWLPYELRNNNGAFDSHGGRYFAIASYSTFHLTIIDFGPMLDMLHSQGIIE